MLGDMKAGGYGEDCFGHIDLIGVLVDSQELRYAHEELLKQKTALQGRLQDRDGEIERLRNQVLYPTHAHSQSGQCSQSG